MKSGLFSLAQSLTSGMHTYISILRGINVSGQKKINMNDLKAVYESLSFKNVKTYIQSGNVLFQTKKIAERTIAHKIEQAIKKHYDFDVPVIVLTLDELNHAIGNNPFRKEKSINMDRVYITFLAEEAAKENVDKTNTLDFSPDRFVISGREIYIHCPISYGNSKINNNFFENKLKVTATTRNWKTVNELKRLAETMISAV